MVRLGIFLSVWGIFLCVWGYCFVLSAMVVRGSRGRRENGARPGSRLHYLNKISKPQQRSETEIRSIRRIAKRKNAETTPTPAVPASITPPKDGGRSRSKSAEQRQALGGGLRVSLLSHSQYDHIHPTSKPTLILPYHSLLPHPPALTPAVEHCTEARAGHIAGMSRVLRVDTGA